MRVSSTIRICGHCRYYQRGWCDWVGYVSCRRLACGSYDEDPEAVAADRRRAEQAANPEPEAGPVTTYKLEVNTMAITPEKRQEIIEVYKANGSVKETAKVTGVAHVTVRRTLRKAGVPTPAEVARRESSPMPDPVLGDPLELRKLTVDQLRQQLQERIAQHKHELEEAQRALTALTQLQELYGKELAAPLLAGVWQQYEARRAKTAEVAA